MGNLIGDGCCNGGTKRKWKPCFQADWLAKIKYLILFNSQLKSIFHHSASHGCPLAQQGFKINNTQNFNGETRNHFPHSLIYLSKDLESVDKM